MAYELDFIGVNEETKDADSIGIRWITNDQDYVVGVYDGGVKVYGEKLKEHMDEHYFNGTEENEIDFIICSHSDQDHTSGIKVLLENYTVEALYMNRPWIYIDEIFDKVNDGRITKESLIERLKKSYSYIAELEEISLSKEIPIYESFQGTVINDNLTILSPTKEFYIELIVESHKTPLEEASLQEASFLRKALINAYEKIMDVIESWSVEKLRENVKTSSENEMSIVILGQISDEKFLLTGDAGLRALNNSIEYANSIFISIKDEVNFYQIPHHGGRHNISPSLLNSIIGEIVTEGETIGKTAFVSAGKNSNHPLKMVVNAFTRRGVKVYKTNGGIIHHNRNMPERKGWINITKLELTTKVEEWEK